MMLLRQLFDAESSTYTYLVADMETREALVIDPVREQLERDVALLEELELSLRYVLETHVHADHVTSAGVLRKRFGAQTVLSARAGTGCPDILVEDGDEIRLGAITIEARHTPGHTDGDVTYVMTGGATPIAFTGDTLLIRGCGRTDFQQGDSRRLYDSVHERIFTLPDEALIYPAHDYKGRTVSTVREEKRYNPRLGAGISRDQFVDIMNQLKLAQPKKIDEALPANLRCGIVQSATVAPPPPEPTAPAWLRSGDGVFEVSADWTRAHRASARIIDVRRRDEVAGPLGLIEGAQNIPLDELERALRDWGDIDPEQPIVVVCRSGRRSAVAAAMIERAGFARVASMRGGMTEYRATSVSSEGVRA